TPRLGMGELSFQPIEPAADAAVPNRAAEFYAHPADQFGRHFELCRQIGAVTRAETLAELFACACIERARAFDDRVLFFNFEPREPLVFLEHGEVMARFRCSDLPGDGADFRRI